MRGVGSSLVLCAVTTAAGFYSFIPTTFSGVSELGLIAGTGVFFGLFVSVTLLPALVAWWGDARPSAQRATWLDPRIFAPLSTQAAARARRDGRRAASRRCVALPRVHVRQQSDSLARSRQRVGHHAARARRGRRSAAAESRGRRARSRDGAAPGPSELRAAARGSQRHDDGRSSCRASRKRSSRCSKISTLLLGPGFAELERAPADRRRAATALGDARRRRQLAARGAVRCTMPWSTRARGSRQAGDAERDAHAARSRRRADERSAARARAARQRRSAPQPFDRAALPAALAARWLASDGRELVEIAPAEDVSDNAAARALHRPPCTASCRRPPACRSSIRKRRRPSLRAFERALLYAFVMVSAIIWLVLRDLRDTLLVLVADRARVRSSPPALTVLIGMPFNYANIIALPLLVGIGVDNGIHVVHRMRTEQRRGSCSTRARCAPCSRAASRRSRASATSRSRRTSAPRAWASCSRSGLATSMAATLVVLPAWLKLRGARWQSARGMTRACRLVTGANGFLGSAVVRALLADGQSPCARSCAPAAIGATSTGSTSRSRPAISPIATSLRARGCRAAPPCSTSRPTIGSGSLDAAPMYRANVDGSVNVLEAAAAAGVERMVYTSSVAVLGINDDRTPADETHARRRRRHGRPLQALEVPRRRGRAPSVRASSTSRVVIVNPSTPIGPRDIKPTPTGRIMLDAAAGRMPAFVDTGLNLVHVDDVASRPSAGADVRRGAASATYSAARI